MNILPRPTEGRRRSPGGAGAGGEKPGTPLLNARVPAPPHRGTALVGCPAGRHPTLQAACRGGSGGLRVCPAGGRTAQSSDSAALEQHWNCIRTTTRSRRCSTAAPMLFQCCSNTAPPLLKCCSKKNGKPKMGGGERPAPGREKRKKGRCMGKTPSWRGLPRTRRMSARVPQGISPDRG